VFIPVLLSVGHANQEPRGRAYNHHHHSDNPHHLSSSFHDARQMASIRTPTAAPAIAAGINHHADIIFVLPLVPQISLC
jgi:hypothetical protein